MPYMNHIPGSNSATTAPSVAPQAPSFTADQVQQLQSMGINTLEQLQGLIGLLSHTQRNPNAYNPETTIFPTVTNNPGYVRDDGGAQGWIEGGKPDPQGDWRPGRPLTTLPQQPDNRGDVSGNPAEFNGAQILPQGVIDQLKEAQRQTTLRTVQEGERRPDRLAKSKADFDKQELANHYKYSYENRMPRK